MDGGGVLGENACKPVTTVQACVLTFVSVKTTGFPTLFGAMFFEILGHLQQCLCLNLTRPCT